MNGEDKLNKICGVTEFALYKKECLPEVSAYNYYENYLKKIEKKVKLQNYNVQITNKNLDFQYTHSFNINATAFIKDSKEYIKIGEGVIVRIYHMFSELLVHNTFSQFNLDEVKECVNLHLKFENDGIIENEIIYRLPDNDKRKILAEYLSMFATKFVILHELGHHYNGHVLYCKEKFQIEELQINETNSIIGPILSQTFEMDADAFAICQLAREIIDIIKNDKRIKTVIKDNKDILGLFFYSMYCLFFILANGEERFDNLKDKYYIPITLRYCYIIEHLKAYFERYEKELFMNIDFDNVNDKYTKMANAEYRLTFMSGKKRDIDLDGLINSKEHYNILRNCWKEIRNQLEKFARCPISK